MSFWWSADSGFHADKTCSLYGENERLVGEWFRRTGKRNDIFFATKFGFVRGGPKFGALDSSAEYCKKACAESLQKLGIDSIDLCTSLSSSLVVSVMTNIDDTPRLHASCQPRHAHRRNDACHGRASSVRLCMCLTKCTH